ncbi:unnamed protein product [Absidia cylindrospora]
MADSPAKIVLTKEIQETNFAIMVVSIGMSCFVWQAFESGEMYYKKRKPVIAVVLAQAILGVVVTFVTLLTSVIEVNCTFRLYFSVFGVNAADIALQSVLLWKAFLGNNRSKIVLLVGALPLLGIVAFIGLNITIGKSQTHFADGACSTDYPTFIVLVKAILDFSSNAFLSACFLFVIYRHYRERGTSIHRTLIKEGLIYCFGVCLSNIVTGILLMLKVLGGASPVVYTIDWYVASYLIIKQFKASRRIEKEELETELDEDDMKISQFSYNENMDIIPQRGGSPKYEYGQQSINTNPESPLTEITAVASPYPMK